METWPTAAMFVKRLRHSPAEAVCLGVLLLAVNLVVLGPYMLRSAWLGIGDFPGLFVGARLVSANKEYDVASVLRLQAEIIGEQHPKLLSVRLPFYYQLLSPLGRMSYLSAHHLWVALMIISAAAAAMIYPCKNRIHLVSASLASLPLLQSIIQAQDIALVWLILAAGLRLRASGRPLVGGLILSLLLIKFQLFLALPLIFLIRRETRLLIGASLGLAVLIAWSFAVGGRSFPVEYWHMVSNPVASPGPAVMPNLHGIAFRFPAPAAIEVVLAILVLVAAASVARSSIEISLAAGLLSGILVSHHCYSADCTVLIPALLTLCRLQNIFLVAGAVFGLCSIPYFLTTYMDLGAVSALLFSVLLFILACSAPGRALSSDAAWH